MESAAPYWLTVALAGLGAASACLAALGKALGRLGEDAARRIYYVAYTLTGLSLAFFVVRGLAQ